MHRCLHIPEYVATKDAIRFVKIQLSARATSVVNSLLDYLLIHIVNQPSTTNSYDINHYHSVLLEVISDSFLVSKCIAEAKLRSTQLITGLSLDYVMSSIENDQTDTKKQHDHPQYLCQMRKFIISCGILTRKQAATCFKVRPGSEYFSIHVGLLIVATLEQVAKYALSQICHSTQSLGLSSVSADRVAYIFYHDPIINKLIDETPFFQSLEVKTVKASTLEDYESIIDEELSEISPSSSISLHRSASLTADNQSLSHSIDEATCINSISNHLSTNLAMNLDKARDFEAVFNSGQTIKLSLTPSRLRAISSKSNNNSKDSLPPLRRRSLLKVLNIFKDNST